MIRIKCPKCATALTVDDSAAGGVGECTDCGTKFRIPATKVTVPPRVTNDNDDDEEEERAMRRRPPRRRRDEDDEDSREEVLTPEERERLKRLAAIESDAFMRNLKMAGALVLACIVVFIGGLFINRMGWYVAIFGVITFATCIFTVSRLAKRESMLWFFLIVFFGIMMVFVYIIFNWEVTKRFLLAAIAGIVIMVVGATSGLIYEAKKIARREIIKERVKQIEGTPGSWHWQRPGEERQGWAGIAPKKSATVAAWMRSVPVPGRLDNAPQVGVARPPTEFALNLG